MASLRSHLVRWVIRRMFRPQSMTADRVARALAAPKRSHVPPAQLRRRRRVDLQLVAGHPLYVVRPEAPERRVVFLHGGAYVSEIYPEHWKLIGELSAHAEVWVPIYPLAPGAGHREAFPFVRAVWERALAAGPPPDVLGDSAGGGLALALTALARDAGLPLPRKLHLISPWLELTMTHPDIAAIARRDPMLEPTYLRAAGLAWAEGEDVRAPLLSPVNLDPRGLPPIHVWIGTDDILYPDTQTFIERATAAGVAVQATVGRGLIHDYPLMPIPEGQRARRALIEALRAP